MTIKTRSIALFEPVQANQAFKGLWHVAKPWLIAGHRLVLVLKPETRRLAQNAKFHALCDDIARSGHKWMGKARTAKEWKILMVSGHAVATKESSELTVGLEGEMVQLRESTALMSVKRSSSLIEYTVAWMAMNGINQAGEQ